ncbi:hypothetical protein VTN02DRAFT_4551 [Thermoascus thermophilus]
MGEGRLAASRGIVPVDSEGTGTPQTKNRENSAEHALLSRGDGGQRTESLDSCSMHTLDSPDIVYDVPLASSVLHGVDCCQQPPARPAPPRLAFCLCFRPFVTYLRQSQTLVTSHFPFS